MPRYFFDMHDGASCRDDVGLELPSLEDAKAELSRIASTSLADKPVDFWSDPGWSFDLRDHRGLVLFTVHVLATSAAAARNRSPQGTITLK